MPMFMDPETGIPGYRFDLPPEDPANPDTIPVADTSTPPRDPDDDEDDFEPGEFEPTEDDPDDHPEPDPEVEHEGVVALPGNPDFDKTQPPPELPSGDEDDNEQPGGSNDDDVPDANKHPPAREVPSDMPAPEWEQPPRGPAPEPA